MLSTSRGPSFEFDKINILSKKSNIILTEKGKYGIMRRNQQKRMDRMDRHDQFLPKKNQAEVYPLLLR